VTFWSSSETTNDASAALRPFDRSLEKIINALLENLQLEPQWAGWQWAFIAMVLSADFADLYTERVRRSNINKFLEFRLIIPHDRFLSGSFDVRVELYTAQLHRAIDFMAKWKMSVADRNHLHNVVEQAQRTLTG
jgi:hypothetical protein